MIDKEKLIKDLEDRLKNHEYYINVNGLLTDLKSGHYEARCVDTHDVDEFYMDDKYYPDDEEVWCK